MTQKEIARLAAAGIQPFTGRFTEPPYIIDGEVKFMQCCRRFPMCDGWRGHRVCEYYVPDEQVFCTAMEARYPGRIPWDKLDSRNLKKRGKADPKTAPLP